MRTNHFIVAALLWAPVSFAQPLEFLEVMETNGKNLVVDFGAEDPAPYKESYAELKVVGREGTSLPRFKNFRKTCGKSMDQKTETCRFLGDYTTAAEYPAKKHPDLAALTGPRTITDFETVEAHKFSGSKADFIRSVSPSKTEIKSYANRPGNTYWWQFDEKNKQALHFTQYQEIQPVEMDRINECWLTPKRKATRLTCPYGVWWEFENGKLLRYVSENEAINPPQGATPGRGTSEALQKLVFGDFTPLNADGSVIGRFTFDQTRKVYVWQKMMAYNRPNEGTVQDLDKCIIDTMGPFTTIFCEHPGENETWVFEGRKLAFKTVAFRVLAKFKKNGEVQYLVKMERQLVLVRKEGGDWKIIASPSNHAEC